MPERIDLLTLRTSLGDFSLARSSRGLCRVDFAGVRETAGSLERLRAGLSRRFGSLDLRPESRSLEAESAWLADFLENPARSRRYEGPLDPGGTEFQRRVWDVLRAIPSGRARSYGEVAALVGSPLASRAVGAACAANPLIIFIPCHRVVGSDRSLTGFGGGLDLKQWLLTAEGFLAPSLPLG